MKIAICFFGITRSLNHTIHSIKTNVLEPAKAIGEVKVFAHFFDQERVESKRSREFINLDRTEHVLLSPDVLRLEKPYKCIDLYDFEGLKSFGDTRRDGFQSLRNLVHALHSLKSVTEIALDWNPDLVVFVRPDLEYHDSLFDSLTTAALTKGDYIFIPNWQHWRGGLNDRFAICTSANSAKAYGTRADAMLSYCQHFGEALHSESLNRYALENENIGIRFMDVRASRVRAGGCVKNEIFGRSYSDAAKTWVRTQWRGFRGKNSWVSNEYRSQTMQTTDNKTKAH